jgi:hypothetical protein
MMDDAIFQAKCQIEYLESGLEYGGRIVAYDPATMTIYLHDESGSEQTIYMEPVAELLARVAKMKVPATPPA